MPSHAAMPLEQLERLLCKQLGHVVVQSTRGEPVTAFPVCKRCGKFWRSEADIDG